MRQKDITTLIELRKEDMEAALKAVGDKHVTFKTMATKCPKCGHEFII